MSRFWTVVVAGTISITSHAIPQDGAEDSPEFARAEARLAQSVARAQVEALVATHQRDLLDLYITLVETENQFAKLAIQDVLDGSVVLDPPVVDTAYAKPHLARMVRAAQASDSWRIHSIEVLAFCYQIDRMLREFIHAGSQYRGPLLYLDAGIPDWSHMAREFRASREDDAIRNYTQEPSFYDKAGIPMTEDGHIDWEAIRSSDDRAELEQLVERVEASRQAFSDLKRAESIRSRFAESVRSVCRPLLERLSEAEVVYVDRIGAEIAADSTAMAGIREWCSSILAE